MIATFGPRVEHSVPQGNLGLGIDAGGGGG
jgi:hypothetical protein